MQGIGSVLLLSRVLTLCDPMDCSTPGLPVHHQLLEPTQTYVHRVGDATQPSNPLSSPSSPAFNLSQQKDLFQWVSSLHQVAKYWNFSFSISPSNGYSGLISYMIDWLDLLGVQETLNTRSKHILFTPECAGSNPLTTKIGEVPVTLTYKMDLSFLTLTQTSFFFNNFFSIYFY